MVCYSYLFKNCLQFVVKHTVKGFSIVNAAEVNVFLEFPCFLYDPTNVGNLISGSSAFSKPNLYIWKFLGFGSSMSIWLFLIGSSSPLRFQICWFFTYFLLHCFLYSTSLHFHINFRINLAISTKVSCWDFDCYCIECINQLKKDCYLENIKSIKL